MATKTVKNGGGENGYCLFVNVPLISLIIRDLAFLPKLMVLGLVELTFQHMTQADSREDESSILICLRTEPLEILSVRLIGMYFIPLSVVWVNGRVFFLNK